MDIQHLIKMANQIGQFFSAEPDREQALKDVALHLKRFWNPKMRHALLLHVETGGDGLYPILIDAIRENHELLH